MTSGGKLVYTLSSLFFIMFVPLSIENAPHAKQSTKNSSTPCKAKNPFCFIARLWWWWLWFVYSNSFTVIYCYLIFGFDAVPLLIHRATIGVFLMMLLMLVHSTFDKFTLIKQPFMWRDSFCRVFFSSPVFIIKILFQYNLAQSTLCSCPRFD